MKFHGLQKLTLLDYPGKVAATLFTAGCNFKCPFCHNASLVTHIQNGQVYDEEEVLTYLKKRKGILDGICITGGEPLLHEDILPFVRRVKELGYAVKLDTNGSFPERLAALVKEGLLDYVAMDIKNCREKYPLTVGIEGFSIEAVEKSVAFLLAGKVDYEFRTTVVRELHTLADIEAIGRWIEGAEKYFLQNFVDSGDLIGCGLSAQTPDIMRKMKEIISGFVKKTDIRGV